MKRILLFSLSVFFCICSLSAENVQQIVGNIISSYSANNKAVSASYSVTSNQGHSSGTIVMSGNKFRILSNDLKCWYDGKTQWAYSRASGEVNVTNPTAEELQMSNPYAAAINFKNNYNATVVSQSATGYTLKLLPKSKSAQVTQVILTVSKNFEIQKAVFTMRNKTTVSVALSAYKRGGNYEASTFVYNKNLVPKGTPINDLR